MSGWLGAGYPWVKAAHVVFMIFWMAGLFALPRFLVYHQEAAPGSAEAALWVEREAKLRKIILTPSLILTWLFGGMLAANIGLFDGQPGLGWLHAKLGFVVLLSGYHGWAASYGKRLASGRPLLTAKQLRLVNELPALLIVAIVVMVMVRPF